MSDNFSWSVNAGRWTGIPIRVHLFLFLFVAIIFGVQWNNSAPNVNILFSSAMVTVIVLIGSLILHELAHVFAISNLGGHVNNLVLMPWGGNSDFVLPATGYSRALVHFAGPFVNGVVFLFGSALLVQSEYSSFFHLINPLEQHGFNMSRWQAALIEIVTWVNFQLMIINLIPCYPFDGAGIVRSLINAMNTDLTRFRIESAIRLIGNLVAFAFIGLAWFLRDYQAEHFQPTWLLFLMFGITLIFCAKYSLQIETQESDSDWDEMEEMDYDSIYSDSSFFDFAEDSENTAYSQWLQEKQEARRESEIRIEEEEDRRADDILKKLHRDGAKSLTDDERSILDRVSARIRRRRQQGV